MERKTLGATAPKWFISKSAIKASVKKPVGFEAWFYTGPSLNFGHFPPAKSGKKR